MIIEGSALLLAVLVPVRAVVALIGAVVPIVLVGVTVAAKIDAVQEDPKNPALDGFDLLGGSSARLVRHGPDPNHHDNPMALGRQRDTVRDRDYGRAIAQYEVEIVYRRLEQLTHALRANQFSWIGRRRSTREDRQVARRRGLGEIGQRIAVEQSGAESTHIRQTEESVERGTWKIGIDEAHA